MKRSGTLLVLVAAVAVWLASPELAWPARAMTAFLLAVLPALVLAQRQATREVPDQVPRRIVYMSTMVGIAVLAIVTMAVAHRAGFGAAELGLVLPAPGPLMAWTAVAVVAGVTILAAGRALRISETPLLEYLLPRSRAERVGFATVSVTAAIGEELVFRAFLIPALILASGATWFAAVLSSAVFGTLHTYQGTAGMVRTGVLGLVLAIVFIGSGSVVPAILAHALINLVAGLWLADWLLRR